MNIKTKEGARNKGNPYFLRVPWNKGGLVNTGPEVPDIKCFIIVKYDNAVYISLLHIQMGSILSYQ